MANTQVHGKVISGSQQQWMTRNSQAGGWANGVWNMVFVGVEGAPESHCSNVGGDPYISISKTAVIAEKPFVSIDASGKYFLNIPTLQKSSSGFNFDDPATKVDFSKVYVADATKDTAETINAKLSQGLHLVLSAGIYELQSPLVVNHANQVILGLGMATLVAANGNAAIQVGNVDGVKISGLLLEAGAKESEALLEWGSTIYGSNTMKYPGSAANPGFLHDVFGRVGGPSTESRAKVMVRINNGNVIGDNLWMWRADHTASGLVKNGDAPCNNAYVVNGDDVTMYGMAGEHLLQDIVQWNGERGATYFFQSELPYDVNQSYGDAGYAGYSVAQNVKEHKGYGIGVYHYFRDHTVVVKSGIKCPTDLESSFYYPLSVFLNGKGTVSHVLNDKGAASLKNPTKSGAQPQWICDNQIPPDAVKTVVV
jgi:hypothetical protein